MVQIIAERFVRTIKGRIYKKLSINANNKWTLYLNKCMKSYNNTVHRTIGMKPVEVTKSKEKMLLRTVYNYEKVLGKPKFKIGDCVRLSRASTIFRKSYKINYTPEVFDICKINRTIPVTYLVEDENYEIIQGRFYEQVSNKAFQIF